MQESRTFFENRARIKLPATVAGAAVRLRALASHEGWRNLPSLALVTLLPAALARDIWQFVLSGGTPRAWDGAGHFAASQIFSRAVFPDTFGWLPEYFAGMPFPNFYPPLFFWVVSLLDSTGLVSHLAAFKLMFSVPVLLLPAALWWLGYALSGKDRAVATSASLFAVIFLVDLRTWTGGIPTGLDYYSTFQIGLYTQPLGFLLCLLWYVSYIKTDLIRSWRFVTSCLLLALAALANFFITPVVCAFVFASLARGVVRLVRSGAGSEREVVGARLRAQLACPLVAFALTLFWAVPMLRAFDLFVTRPYVFRTLDLISPLMWALYLLAAVGAACWLRRPTPGVRAYLAACLVLVAGVAAAGTFAPSWFPLQPSRFLGSLNFLLCLPAGYLPAAIFRRFVVAQARLDDANARPAAEGLFSYTNIIILVIILDAFLFLRVPPVDMAFYHGAESQEVNEVLRFAQGHRDGRYLVEADLEEGARKFDARAINAFLGAQGNETLTAVYHEASPNALFFLPLVNVFSGRADNFGVSSALAEDLDFAEQPLPRHLDRARRAGVRYLVVCTPEVKARLDREPGLGARHDFGQWSVYELGGEPEPRAQALRYRPALVLSDLTFKLRNRHDYNFARLAEEQFADGWFDVLLTHSPETKIDRLRGLEKFGALVLDRYDYDEEERAFRLLRDFAARRTLILLSSEDPLYERIRAAREEFPRAAFVEREAAGDDNAPLAASEPEYRHRHSPVRRDWAKIRALLDEHKVASGAPRPVAASFERDAINLDLRADPEAGEVPVLVASTYHPNWRRDDGGELFAATPFHTLTFVERPTRLGFARSTPDRAALWLSAVTFGALFLCPFFAPRDDFP